MSNDEQKDDGVPRDEEGRRLVIVSTKLTFVIPPDLPEINLILDDASEYWLAP